MAVFLRTAAGALLTVVLALAVGKQDRHIAIVATLAACCAVAAAAVSFLWPVMDFFRELYGVLGLEHGEMNSLLKIVGIGLITEIAALVCQDGGSASLGRTLQMAGTALILQLTVPIARSLMELIREIMGGL